MNFTTVLVIQASPERVLSVLCDVETWPHWTSTMISVHRLDNGPFVVGSKARVRQPRLLPAVWQVTELDQRRGFTWETRMPGIHIRARHNVEALGTGSRVTLSLKFSGFLGPVAARLLRRLNELYLATEARGLQLRCEA